MKAFICLVTALSGQRAAGFASDPEVVDLSPALTVRDVVTTRYIVDKNFNLFMASHRDAGPSERRDWFKHFVAQAYIKSSLSLDGWETRPEVVDSVNRMSRYILTQSEGPYYQALYKGGEARSLTPELAQQTRQIFDAVIARFHRSEDVAALQASTSGLDEASLRSFVTQHPWAAIEFHEGKIIWPYHPFEDIDGDLRGAEIGKCIGPLRRDSGTYFLFVRAKSIGPLQDVVERGEDFRRYLNDLYKLSVRQRHRREILRAEKFAVDEARFAEIYQSLLATHLDALSDSLANVCLATYEPATGQPHMITVRRLQEHVQSEVIRQIPKNVAELREGLADIVVEDADFRDAVARGFAETPKFLQDRQNFAWNQILDLYENTELRPTLHLERERLKAYFDQHSQSFRRPIEATGGIYIFSSVEEAGAARADVAAHAGRNAEKIIEPFVVRRNDTNIFQNVSNEILLNLQDGGCVGPFLFAGKPALFVKRAGKVEVAPFDLVQSQVAAVVARADLDEIELRRFATRSAEPRVAITINFSAYGIGDPFADAINFPAPTVSSPRTNEQMVSVSAVTSARPPAGE